MSASIHCPFWKSTTQVGWWNGSCAQLMWPSRAGSNVTVANGAIVSRPAMIAWAVPAGNEGSGPHALASSAAVTPVPPPVHGCAEATPLQPANSADKERTTTPATQAARFTVETIRRTWPALNPYRHRHNELTKTVADKGGTTGNGAPNPRPASPPGGACCAGPRP